MWELKSGRPRRAAPTITYIVICCQNYQLPPRSLLNTIPCFFKYFVLGVVAMKFPIMLMMLSLIGLTTIGMQDEKVTPDTALAELKAGNAHHVQHKYQHPHET